MKPLIFCFGIAALLASCSQEQPEVAAQPTSDLPESMNDKYDAKLAAELGADDYGMRRYVMAFLKMGPNRDQDSSTAAQLQRAHLDNIQRMADAKQLVVAGPFMDAGDIRGIYIFNVETVEEAEALTQTDPAIKAGRLVMELHPWYGSAALMEVTRIHKKVSKNEI